jgi:hypothetical protein
MGDIEALLAVAKGQNGLFTAAQAREHGLSRDWVNHRVGDRLSVVLPRVYWTSTGEPPRGVQIDAARLHAGPDSVLSHWTAGETWRFRLDKRPEVHLTVPEKQRVADVPGKVRVHRSADLDDDVRRTRSGRLVTTVERTLVDIVAPNSSRRFVRATTADVVQRGLTVPSKIVTELARRPSLPGLATIAEVLVAVSDGARSVLEAELREHIDRADLPPALHNISVPGHGGRHYTVDTVWPAAHLICEVDGREWHLSPDHWERDLERTVDLTDAGFIVLRFTAKAIRQRTKHTLDVIGRRLAASSGASQ